MKLLIVAGAALLLSACGASTTAPIAPVASPVSPEGAPAVAPRSLSVSLTASDPTITHGITVCLGQPRTQPPASQCAQTNGQGVAQIPLGQLAPGRYGIVVYCKNSQTVNWVEDSYPNPDHNPALITIPASGTPEPQSVSKACW